MEIAITSIGVANPPYKRNQQDTLDLITAGIDLSAVEKRLLRSVYKSTGILHRHSVLRDYCEAPGNWTFFPNDPASAFPSTAARMKIYKENALQLALQAIHNCFDQTNTDKSQITHLITISCTGMYAPGLDIEIVQQFNLHSETERTAINFMGCYGTFNGIKAAVAICKAYPNAKVLLVSVELCTIHFQKEMNLDNIIANAIFADGAGALIIESNPKASKYLSFEAFHCDLLPQTHQQMAWEIADSGFDIVLSSYVPQIIHSGIAAFTDALLRKKQLNLADVDMFAIHPGGIKILEACENALQITKEQNEHAYHVLKNFGNMSSATIIFVLKNLFDFLTEKEQFQKIFSCAFGPGLTLESMLLRVQYV